MRIEPRFDSAGDVHYCSQAIQMANKSFFSSNDAPLLEQLKLAQSILQEATEIRARPNYGYEQQKVALSFVFGIQVNTLAINEQECLWLLDNPLLKKNDDKFFVIHRLSSLRLERIAPTEWYKSYDGQKASMWNHKVQVTQLMPCLGYEPHETNETIQFPIESGNQYLSLCDKYGFTALVFHNALDRDNVFCASIDAAKDLCGHQSSRNGLYGVTILPKDSKNKVVKNPQNWIYPKGFKFSERWRYATKFISEHERDVQAYMFAQKQVELPVKGELWKASRMLDVAFGYRDWFAPITNNSYQTQRGGVSSFTGQYEASNDTHHVRVWGTSSTGDAWVAFDGGVFYEIKPNRPS